jgi:uncharacterized membrane protein
MTRAKSMLKRLIRYFLQGLLLFGPAGITLYGAFLLFSYIDGFVISPIAGYLPFKIPGLGILILLVITTLLGIAGHTILIRPLRSLFDKLMESLPVVKVIYSALKDFFSAFVGSEKKFNKPVLVKVNTISNLEKIGFVTTEDLSDIGIVDKVSVYFPHSYNFSGEMFIVPREHITPLNIQPSEAMKFFVSGGVTKV